MTWEQFLWGDDQGYRLRTFDRTRLSADLVHVIRDIMTLILLMQIFISWFYDRQYTMIFLTNWGLHMTFISISLNSQAATDQIQNPGKVTGLKFFRWRFAVLLFQVTITTEIVLSTIFWALLWNPPAEKRFIDYFNITTHLGPAIFLILDFLMQKWIFKYNHIVVIFGVLISYTVFNFSYVKYYGHVIYPILTWEDMSSFILIGVIIVMAYLSHILLYTLSLINRVSTYLPFKTTYIKCKPLLDTNSFTQGYLTSSYGQIQHYKKVLEDPID